MGGSSEVSKCSIERNRAEAKLNKMSGEVNVRRKLSIIVTHSTRKQNEYCYVHRK